MVQQADTKYGQDKCNNLKNKTSVNITAPVHSTQVLARHATWESLVQTGQTNIQASYRAKFIILRASDKFDPSYAELTIKLSILENEIAKCDYKLSNKIPIGMYGSEKTAYGNDWHT